MTIIDLIDFCEYSSLDGHLFSNIFEEMFIKRVTPDSFHPHLDCRRCDGSLKLGTKLVSIWDEYGPSRGTPL
jgi:hypothetical protein